MTGVIDYGVGNLFSLTSSLRAIGETCVVSSDIETLSGCDRLILPGVGAFGAAMDKLTEKNLAGFLREFASRGRPLLGICLGMQLLFERSFEFGVREGLGLIKGEILSLEDKLKEKKISLKVPAIGWNELIYTKNIFSGDPTRSSFVYYVHSFYAPVEDYTAAYSNYGVPVTGIAAYQNVAGCQFHPEKSGKVGLEILRAFCKGGFK